ncbi:MAG: CoA transferase [Acidimicrobiia bacterium]|nr:CoA transferase [Acidimicrobiia bacterium]
MTAAADPSDLPTRPVLAGVRVLDIGTLLAGPVAATFLGDFGAEVIKVEQPEIGDTLRQSGQEADPGRSFPWLVEGRNKRSVTINLRVPAGQELLKRLVATADVLIENFTPGTLERWNLGWDELRAVNPALVMVRMSGFGQVGPYSGRSGYDRIGLGFSGFMYPTGYPDRPPVRPAFPTADYSTAVMAAFATMLALYERDASPPSDAGAPLAERRGGVGAPLAERRGQMVDLALYDTPFRITADLLANFAHRGQIRERIGNRNPGFAPAGNFLTADERWMQIAAGGDNVWKRLCAAMNAEELVTDPRYVTQAARAAHADELEELVGAWVGSLDYAEAEARLVEAGVASGGIYTSADILADPHYEARGSIARVDVDGVGEVPMPAVVPKLSRTPGAIRHAGPHLGADTAAVLAELGLDDAEIAALRADRVI